jgi:hypothetical protein
MFSGFFLNTIHVLNDIDISRINNPGTSHCFYVSYPCNYCIPFFSNLIVTSGRYERILFNSYTFYFRQDEFTNCKLTYRILNLAFPPYNLQDAFILTSHIMINEFEKKLYRRFRMNS